MNHKTTVFIIALATSLIFVMPLGLVKADEKERYCGNQEWTGTGHDDNSPSEKEFKQMLKEDSFCETVKAIDHMEVKGNIKDFDSFKETKVWKTAGSEAKMCMVDAFDLGDSLADYEMLECAYT